ncbi:DNA ligase [Marinomonas epiphytica]
MLKQYIAACLLCFGVVSAWAQPDVQLANVLSDNVQIEEYLVSEKYDGIRAIWTGQKLLTRKGNEIHAPAWFIEPLPNIWLDGELWSKRQDFEFISSVVRKKKPQNAQWQSIRYMVFDAPDKARLLTFEERYVRYQRIVAELGVSHIQPVEQRSLNSTDELYQMLKERVADGAEGLMLHRKAALFHHGRSDNLLKLKPYLDAEARVTKILPGKGKYLGKMGSIEVAMPSGLRFKIGTGFTDAERESPPQIGDLITYQYQGFTKRGLPRFTSFLRVRHPVEP